MLTTNARFSVDLARVLERLSILNFIEFFGIEPVYGKVDYNVYVPMREPRNFPPGFFVVRGHHSRRQGLLNDGYGFGLVSKPVAEILRAQPSTRARIRERLLRELERFE